ncbi:hypothetical protein OH76DRAFT_11995 [Lentinus brumalis]|uniref:F-box domain-containing protein n=1 Tax=Lentinus brumalis TaxID=2498619 RepID=A0A371DWZ6_9APHY|nr:hypothetical protein OH76DRAFT_11995 [Polyporus brumalis]
MRSKQWSGVAKTLRAGRGLGRAIFHWAPRPSGTFCSLPEDVLVCILSYCDLRDLMSCMLVCRQLGNVVRTNDCLLRYKTLLAANGMVDGPLDHLGKLQMLQQYVALSGSGTYVNTHSRYCSPIDARNNDWTISFSFSSCNSYIITKRQEAVTEVYAPPEFPGSRSIRHWTIPLDTFPGETNRAVAVDPAQDLLLVFQRETFSEWDVAVHIRSLQDAFTPHPNAVLPILHTAPSLLMLSHLSAIQIHRHHVAWMQLSRDTGLGAQIEIWDWQAGRMIWRHQFGVEVSFALLDAAHIVVTSNTWKDLRVFRFDPPSDPSVDVLRLNLPLEHISHRIQVFPTHPRTRLSGQTRNSG